MAGRTSRRGRYGAPPVDGRGVSTRSQTVHAAPDATPSTAVLAGTTSTAIPAAPDATPSTAIPAGTTSTAIPAAPDATPSTAIPAGTTSTAIPAAPDASLPPEVAAPRKNVRGPTRRTLETTRGPDDPRVRVELSKGKPVCGNKKSFKRTVLGWLKQPAVLPQNVKKYDDIQFAKKAAYFERVNDLFELVKYIRPGEDQEATSSPAPTTSDATTTSLAGTQAPIQASSTAVAPTRIRGRPGDPTSCIASLPVVERGLFEGWIRDKFRDHRYDICKKYYDPYQTDEERITHRPPTWPEDHWRFVVQYWGTDEFKASRERGKKAKAQSKDKHTTGSESYQSKRIKMMLATGCSEIDECDFYRETHTRKDGTFVDEVSRLNSEAMVTLTQELTLETGRCSVGSGVVMIGILGPGTKGRERLQGRSEPKGKERVSLDELRGITAQYEERARDLDRQYQEKTRELERQEEDRVRQEEERVRREEERVRREEAREQENAQMRAQVAQLMKLLQNQGPPPPPPSS